MCLLNCLIIITLILVSIKICNFHSRYLEKPNLTVSHHMNHDYSQPSKLSLVKTVPTMVLTAQIPLLDGNLGSKGLQKLGFLCPA